MGGVELKIRPVSLLKKKNNDKTESRTGVLDEYDDLHANLITVGMGPNTARKCLLVFPFQIQINILQNCRIMY